MLPSSFPLPPPPLAVREGNRMQDLPPNCHSPLVLLYYPMNTHALADCWGMCSSVTGILRRMTVVYLWKNSKVSWYFLSSTTDWLLVVSSISCLVVQLQDQESGIWGWPMSTIVHDKPPLCSPAVPTWPRRHASQYHLEDRHIDPSCNDEDAS